MDRVCEVGDWPRNGEMKKGVLRGNRADSGASQPVTMKSPSPSYRPGMILTLAALLAAVPAFVRADEPAPEARHEKVKEGAQRIADELGMTADQRAKWKSYAEQERAELDALKADTTVAKEARRAKAGEIRKKYRDLQRAVLTPEQRAKDDQMREHMEKHRAEHGEKPADK
jgi:Spy/CpxP family protein refolding chaperone